LAWSYEVIVVNGNERSYREELVLLGLGVVWLASLLFTDFGGINRTLRLALAALWVFLVIARFVSLVRRRRLDR
jgi:hypothetical protein